MEAEILQLGAIADDDPRWVIHAPYPDLSVIAIAPDQAEAFRRIESSNHTASSLRAAIANSCRFRAGVVARYNAAKLVEIPESCDYGDYGACPVCYAESDEMCSTREREYALKVHVGRLEIEKAT